MTNTTEQKEDEYAGRPKQQRMRDLSKRHGMQRDTRRAEPEESCIDRISRQHDRTRKYKTYRKIVTTIGMSADQIEIKCPAKPITHAFLQFTDNDEETRFSDQRTY